MTPGGPFHETKARQAIQLDEICQALLRLWLTASGDHLLPRSGWPEARRDHPPQQGYTDRQRRWGDGYLVNICPKKEVEDSRHQACREAQGLGACHWDSHTQSNLQALLGWPQRQGAVVWSPGQVPHLQRWARGGVASQDSVEYPQFFMSAG